jgi:DNA-directed RNA polymerase subunit A'
MLRLDEVGIPLVVAMKLSVPERITSWNIEYLKEFVKRGPKVYPGANYIVRPDGKKKKITDETQEALLEEVEPGFSVERHIMDGDIAIFNRQPSLHRMSMMCHRVRVLPYKTFRLNPAVCHPYNADFDGDEMNIHIPQTEEARAEAEILMSIPTQLISPRYGLSVMGCIQDAISGNYMLTTEMEFTYPEAVDLLISIGITDLSSLPNRQKVTGQEIFSVLIPKDFDFRGKSKAKDKEGKNEVIIKDGKLVEGIMDKANLGHEAGLLLRNLRTKYGAERALDIIGKMFRLGIKVLLMRGFTTIISDTDLPEEANARIKEILEKAEADVNSIINLYNQGKLETFPGRTLAETLELKILELLNRARNQTAVIVREFSPITHAWIMAESGARGNYLNLVQMAANVGQQAMRGKRIERGYKGRTLSCFRRGELGPAAHGFIRNNFKSGLQPYEFFFAAITGRDSLMDTALRTPKSGYLYRRLANALQDLKVEYDGTVREASGKIIQFKYGEDGLDVSKSENGKINIQRIIHT